jgi:hypothetical protein
MTASGEKPIEAEYRDLMNAVAAGLSEVFPKPLGFTLLVFRMGSNDGRMNYISSAERGDMITAMKEFIAHNEGHAHDAPESKQ